MNNLSDALERMNDENRKTYTTGEEDRHSSSSNNDYSSNSTNFNMNRNSSSKTKEKSWREEGIEKFHGHYAPLFGAICGVLNVSQSLTCRMFFRCMLRDIFSSAARLNIVGPLEGAKRQREFSMVVEKLHENLEYCDGDDSLSADFFNSKAFSERMKDTCDDDITTINDKMIDMTRKLPEPVTTSPILEILQARHDVLYARLFNS
jgi:urease accessory protein UreF